MSPEGTKGAASVFSLDVAGPPTVAAAAVVAVACELEGVEEGNMLPPNLSHFLACSWITLITKSVVFL